MGKVVFQILKCGHTVGTCNKEQEEVTEEAPMLPTGVKKKELAAETDKNAKLQALQQWADENDVLLPTELNRTNYKRSAENDDTEKPLLSNFKY